MPPSGPMECESTWIGSARRSEYAEGATSAIVRVPRASLCAIAIVSTTSKPVNRVAAAIKANRDIVANLLPQ
jgi:hypothetical protein